MQSRLEVKSHLNIYLFLLSFIPSILVVISIFHFGVDIPQHDQWGTPGKLFLFNISNTLDLSDFFIQHNESRKAFISTIWYLMATTFGWHPLLEMVLTVIFAWTGSLFLFLLSKRVLDVPTRPLILFCIFANILVLSPINMRQWLWGVYSETTLLYMLFCIGLFLNSTSLKFSIKIYLSAFLSILATFTYANGLISWVLIFPGWFKLLDPDQKFFASKKNILLSVVYLLLFASTAIFYFHGFVSSRNHSMGAWREDPLFLIVFYFSWLGAPFRMRAIPEVSAFLAGVLLFTSGIGLGAIRLLRARDSRSIQACLPWIILEAYTLITGAVVSLGRMDAGISMALQNRYLIHQIMLPLALLPLIYATESAKSHALFKPRPTTWLPYLIVVYCLVTSLAAWPYGLQVAHNRLGKIKKGLTALEFAKLYPDNRNMRWLYFPSIRLVRERAAILNEADILHYPVYPLPSNENLIAPALEGEVHIFGHPAQAIQVVLPASEAGHWTHLLLMYKTEGETMRPFQIIQIPPQHPKSTETNFVIRENIDNRSLPKAQLLLSAMLFDANHQKYRNIHWRESFTVSDNKTLTPLK